MRLGVVSGAEEQFRGAVPHRHHHTVRVQAVYMHAYACMHPFVCVRRCVRVCVGDIMSRRATNFRTSSHPPPLISNPKALLLHTPHVRTHTHTHTRTGTHTHTHTHTHTFTHTHIHTPHTHHTRGSATAARDSRVDCIFQRYLEHIQATSLRHIE